MNGWWGKKIRDKKVSQGKIQVYWSHWLTSLDNKVLQMVMQCTMDIIKRVKEEKMIQQLEFFSEEFKYNCMSWSNVLFCFILFLIGIIQ